MRRISALDLFYRPLLGFRFDYIRRFCNSLQKCSLVNPLIGAICDAGHESMKVSMYAGPGRRRSKQAIVFRAGSHVDITDAIAPGQARESGIVFDEAFRAVGKVEVDLEVRMHRPKRQSQHAGY